MLNLLNSAAMPVLDEDGQVIAVLAGQPESAIEDSWHGVHDCMFQGMVKARQDAHFTKKQLFHRYGEFAALTTDALFGGGQKVCLCLALGWTIR